jgi:eukaryotic-like serine/threonine-protein kinase
VFKGDPLQSAVARLIKDPQDRPSTREVTQALHDQAVNSRRKHKVDTGIMPGNEDARVEAVHR